MQEQDILLEQFDQYLTNHKKIVEEIVTDYLTTESFSVDIDSFMEIFPAILYTLYDFSMVSEFLSESLLSELKRLRKIDDYSALTELLIHIWTHGSIPIRALWENNPKMMDRKLLVPIRYNLSDIMYAVLSSLRSDLTKPVIIESEELSFLSGIENPSIEDNSYRASDYPAFTIYQLKNPKMTYGYTDSWVFHLNVSHLRILDKEKSKLPLIILDGKGYGIVEDNLLAAIEFFKNPMATNEAGIRYKDFLGMDLNLCNLKDLISNQDSNFFLTQYRYEANENTLD